MGGLFASVIVLAIVVVVTIGIAQPVEKKPPEPREQNIIPDDWNDGWGE